MTQVLQTLNSLAHPSRQKRQADDALSIDGDFGHEYSAIAKGNLARQAAVCRLLDLAAGSNVS
jgi:hypothetical protein